MNVILTPKATSQLDNIYSNRGIYDRNGRFLPWFIRWNYTFHQYVTESTLSSLSAAHGWFRIDNIGMLMYSIRCFNGIKSVIIEEFSFPSFRFTSAHIPPISVSKNIPYWRSTPFSIPQKARILNGTYYGGLKVAYYNRRYVILKSDGTPFVERWLNKKPIFFKKPFGPYNVIAHVSYNNMLYAIDVNGQMYDLNRMWNDTYIRESFAHMIGILVNERLKSFKSKLLYESRGRVIRINESQICLIVQSIVDRLIA